MKEPTIEEVLELASFGRYRDGKLYIDDVYGNVVGSVWGDVGGDVGNVWGEVHGKVFNIHGKILNK